ncbi:MAG: EAL domain-containing protein [Lachnospiraceae bacterium]|nr:EAL domain-containing protein [Lachnospiraceae bacterium]
MDDIAYPVRIKRSILIVDDEEVNRLILGQMLGDEYETDYAGNGEQAFDMLHDPSVTYSLVLLDLMMPVMDGFELLEKMRADEELVNVPVIVMTSEVPAEVRSIELGADDFITKPYNSPEVIKARCRRIIQLYENRMMIRLAEKDGLTGLYTREFFNEYIEQIDTFDKGMDMDAIVLNVEHFHMVNEMFGRQAGDEVLTQIAGILKKIFERNIFIGSRPDADYFYLYLEHREDYESVFPRLQQELSWVSQIPRIRLRIGIYENADKNSSIVERFDHAKFACDRIRGDYTNQISFYSKELNDADLYHERLINDIDEAIANNDLIVYFQPKYAIQSEKPVLRSAEALIRWKHPTLGMISPGDFIPLFESNGLIQKLDHYVWAKAASSVKSWKERLGITVPVSVNVSRVDIYDPELENRLVRILEENGLEPDELMLEITESAYADDAGGLVETVKKLRQRGFKIEMDDFGSGYSSLNMITTIPIDVLKMDMKFIRNMNKDEKSLRLVELVMDIAEFLGVPVVAEGVEDKAQFETLKKMGCDIIQGYYFSKPLSPQEFETYIINEMAG